MKILWICNSRFSADKIKTTGSWLQPLAEAVAACDGVEIGNVSFGNVDSVQKKTFGNITQYTIPLRKQKDYGHTACGQTCKEVAQCEQDFQPDIVHIWGTESIWASIAAQGYLKTKLQLLEIQGVISSCTQYYMGGLQWRDMLKTIHLKEILMPWRSLLGKQNMFAKRGKKETEYIKHFSLISTQSEWVRQHIHAINPSAQLFNTRIMLRKQFLDAEPWQYHFKGTHPVIFTSASGAISYKGLHQVFKMVELLKRDYPDVELRVAGDMTIGNRLLDGYSVYLRDYINNNDLTSNVTYLGSISAEQIITELQKADVCVVPSFVETYCLALAEALMVGVPCVVSYTSALPETALPDKEALFYNSQDYVMAAAHISRLLTDQKLAVQLSTAARQRRLIENNPQNVVNTQLNIYKQILTQPC